MAKVLFVTHDKISYEILGMEYVSGALLRAGHLTRACEASHAVAECLKWQPDFVAFQIITGDSAYFGKIAARVKDACPRVKTIFGGPHFLFFTGAQQAEADIVIRGEAEEAILEAVEGREWQNLISVSSLDSLAPPDRSIFYNERFPAIRDCVIRNEIACRGCPYKCSYCYNSNKEWQAMVDRTRLRYHSPEYMTDDVMRVVRDYGGSLASFTDDIFGVDVEWLERFARVYKRGCGLPFFAQLRPQLITEDRIKLLKEAGVHIISFAIESGNEKTRDEILDRHEPNEMILRGCELLHKHGIRFRMQNLLALPVADPLEDALETLRFNMKCKPTLSWCSLLQAYPGTEIANYVVKKGLVKSLEELTPMVNDTFFEESSLPIPNRKQIERLHKYWSAVVRWQWMYPFVRVLIYFDFGARIQNWIFNTSKQYINKREYWKVKSWVTDDDWRTEERKVLNVPAIQDVAPQCDV